MFQNIVVRRKKGAHIEFNDFSLDTHTSTKIYYIYYKDRVNDIERFLSFGWKRRDREVCEERDFNSYTGRRGWVCEKIYWCRWVVIGRTTYDWFYIACASATQQQSDVFVFFFPAPEHFCECCSSLFYQLT